MLIEPLPTQADANTWQMIAREQRVKLLEKEALLADKEALLADKEAQIADKDALIAKLTLQIAQLKRLQFAQKSERFAEPEQRQLVEEALAEDIATVEQQLEALLPVDASAKRYAKRQELPADLPRETIVHSIDSLTCKDCGSPLNLIRDQVSERLDYIPGHYVVKRHVRGQYSCRHCDKVISAAMPAQIIDKGIPDAGLLAHVAISKYVDHLPLYRQQQIFARHQINLTRSTLAGWIAAVGLALEPLVNAMQKELLSQTILHADETPVRMLDPGRGKTQKAYIWLYRSTSRADPHIAIYDFQPSRAGQHAQHFLQGYKGELMVDDYSGYKALFNEELLELGCWAHVRRKFFDLFTANKSEYAHTVLEMIQALYKIERQIAQLEATERYKYRQQLAKPIVEQLAQCLATKRAQIPGNTGLANAIDYTQRRWPALIRYLDCGHRPIDNNPGENSIRPIALGRKNWLFAGSLAAGQRAAQIMSLLETAKLNQLDPFVYLKDVLTRLPSQPHRLLSELLPYNWQPKV